MDQGIKSRPIYRPFEIDESGARHLLVTDMPNPSANAFASTVTLERFDEQWTVAGNSRAIPETGVQKQEFRSPRHLLIALAARLQRERMGLRLYAVGAEAFVWDVDATARAHGLGRTEVRYFSEGPQTRRVFCNHCRTITEGAKTNVVPCAGCGANLFVRDHFSRRLNAFAGVQVDAEVPGELPPIEEIYG